MKKVIPFSGESDILVHASGQELFDDAPVDASPDPDREVKMGLPLLAEVDEAIVVFERDGVEVQASLKPGGSQDQPYFIETQLLGRGEPLEDRSHMLVERLRVISLKGVMGEVTEGEVIAPAHIYPVNAVKGLRIAIKGRR